MMGAYDDAAEIYEMGHLWPIPVEGKSRPVGGATGYDGTVTPAKVAAWLDSDPVKRAKAGRGHRMDNIGLRHQLTLAIDVDHGYGDKDGVAQLAAFAAERGLPPLPATWSSTARGDDSPSRQYVYRIPEDVRLKTKPCKSVELCCWHHRYTVCAPSVHPDTGAEYAWYLPGEPGVPPTWGERTTRYPRAEVFPELPAEWFAALRGTAGNVDKSVDTVDLRALVASFPEGEPDGLVRHVMNRWAAPAQHVGHDEFKDAAVHALMLGREGHTGVRVLLDLLWDRFTGYLATAGRPAGEATSLLRACATIAQQKPVKPAEPRGFFQGGSYRGPQGATAQPMPQVPPADDADVETYLATFTRYTDPARLGRRVTWMKADPADLLHHHAWHLISESIAGHYPAEAAVRALIDGHRHHGVMDASSPKTTLKLALGAILNANASAA
ncbi:MAG: bifunctional DNA primase/polymerase [Pseudonocardia sp.]|nr:bifunctional DNA primase/polymerase [Pseudonocardia sp.]